MIGDILWKLIRKLLSENLYASFQKSFLGRYQYYYSFETFKDISETYLRNVHSVEGKTILEAGSGLQFFTALDLLNNGARKVLLVDPVFENKGHLNVLKHHYKEYLNKCGNVHCLNTDKIQVYSSWDFLPAVMNHSIDIIFSHFVLEHVPDLKRYFSQTHKLLAKNGIMFSCVDLTDHTYQIFDSKKWTKWVYRKNMLCHLKYSEKMNRFLSDKRTWVNRLLFPVYVKIADECGFGVVTKKLFSFNNVKIHEDVLKKLPANYCDEELFVSHFELTLSPS